MIEKLVWSPELQKTYVKALSSSYLHGQILPLGYPKEYLTEYSD